MKLFAIVLMPCHFDLRFFQRHSIDPHYLSSFHFHLALPLSVFPHPVGRTLAAAVLHLLRRIGRRRIAARALRTDARQSRAVHASGSRFIAPPRPQR